MFLAMNFSMIWASSHMHSGLVFSWVWIGDGDGDVDVVCKHLKPGLVADPMNPPLLVPVLGGASGDGLA